MKNYRGAFLLLLTLNIILAAGGLAWWGWRTRHAVTVSSPPAGRAGEAPAAPSSAEAPLAPIRLTPQRMQSIGVKIGKVESKPVYDEVRFYGSVQVDERRLAYVQTRFAGWIRKMYADATGQFVRKGQPLFTIYSPDLVTTQREYLLAKANQALLQQSSIGSVTAGAASLVDAAKARLLQWEIPPSEMEKLDQTATVISEVAINSPASGYITEKNALPNMYVQPETKLYTVADLSDVWILAQVFQTDAGKIKPGDPAEVTVDAYPARVFGGRVDYLLPQIDMATRTLPVRLVLPNPGLALRPGMYVNVKLKLPLGKQLVIPASAAFRTGTKNLVFLYSGEGNIEPREVELGSGIGDEIIVLKGLRAGDPIVTSANFLIDSEAQLQAAVGAFTPPPPGVGGGAMTPPASQSNIELTTDPTPPRKGSNTIRVKLTAKGGQPIAGAEVTVTFFMAAMPGMGMGAMKTVVHAGDKGGGMYEGKGDLASGGAWQVTITARQNGQTIGNKQTTVNATGGM